MSEDVSHAVEFRIREYKRELRVESSRLSELQQRLRFAQEKLAVEREQFNELKQKLIQLSKRAGEDQTIPSPRTALEAQTLEQKMVAQVKMVREHEQEAQSLQLGAAQSSDKLKLTQARHDKLEELVAISEARDAAKYEAAEQGEIVETKTSAEAQRLQVNTATNSQDVWQQPNHAEERLNSRREKDQESGKRVSRIDENPEISALVVNEGAKYCHEELSERPSASPEQVSREAVPSRTESAVTLNLERIIDARGWKRLSTEGVILNYEAANGARLALTIHSEDTNGKLRVNIEAESEHERQLFLRNRRELKKKLEEGGYKVHEITVGVANHERC